MDTSFCRKIDRIAGREPHHLFQIGTLCSTSVQELIMATSALVIARPGPGLSFVQSFGLGTVLLMHAVYRQAQRMNRQITSVSLPG